MAAILMNPGGGKPQAAITDAVSIAYADGDSHMYFRIPQGEYMKKAASGYPEIKAWKSDVTDALGGVKCVWAGRCWSNGYAGGSGYSANGSYCTGGNGSYDSWINAGKDGYYAVWENDTFSFKYYTAGTRIGHCSPDNKYPTYRAAYVYI